MTVLASSIVEGIFVHWTQQDVRGPLEKVRFFGPPDPPYPLKKWV